MKLTLDRVIGSSYDNNLQQTIIYRGFVATELPTNQPADVIRQAIVGPGGLPQINTPHPTQPGAFVIGYTIRLTSDSVAEGVVKYSGSTFINKFQFSRRSYLQSIQTEIDPIYPTPDGGEQIHVVISSKLLAFGTGGNVYSQASTQQGKVSYLRPMAVFKATGIFTRAPSVASQQCLGCVNDSAFLGLGPGFWLVNDYNFDSEDLGTTFSVQIQMISLVNEDWSSYIVSINQVTGLPQFIESSTIASLREKNYSTIPNHDNFLISKYGLYKAVSYQGRLGFQPQSSYLNQFTFSPPPQ